MKKTNFPNLLNTDAKELARKQLKSISGGIIVDNERTSFTMLMCPARDGEAPRLISFQNCDDAGYLNDGSGIFCKRGDAIYVQTC
ncbi:hypothetical protein BAX97_02425 [Elizabethkingia meningoseptica]|uniref:hypothetical protein n=1 Tax=Elizabethkingia meningoseptica TaxID=238 RepID=UPI000332C034|nr:hypothetical protein [Elizabethkingia meningoseptica]AQX04749.1 hypothetical protein BBD33_05560 [Elizabethkingia meningoseptica]AQX46791.1 hypothetical protein B5G46_05555 [Elizabethkingia meningoseptica]EOR31233.1 hypothetical protein L100_01533 [Elizabethkingia meningoseptica ATCC 13253 = NBRC 12535]KUY19304.1 hypothetical protein ATB99_05965 [Elizabethkingia meningoseptica]MCL1676605.1 hypothetical protein [Elizabethkingia meningoseptica]